MTNRNFRVEEDIWKDFGYILKIKYNGISRSKKVRDIIIAFNKRHQNILDKRL